MSYRLADREVLTKFIFDKLKDSISVPALYVSGLTIRCGDRTLTYESKNQIKRIAVPQIARYVQAPAQFSFAEKCALVSNLIRKEKSFDNYALFIEPLLIRKIREYVTWVHADTLHLKEMNYQEFLKNYDFPRHFMLYKV